MSTQAPIGGAPGRIPRIGTTAKTMAAIHPSMSVCTTRRRRAVWIATNAASTARTTIIANSSAEYTRMPPDRLTSTRTPPSSRSVATASSPTLHPSASPSTSTRVGWYSTSAPEPVKADTSSGSTRKRSNGHRPAWPSSRIWVSNVVTDVPWGRTSFVRAMLGDTTTVMSRARSLPTGSRNRAPGATVTSASARDVLVRISVRETITRTSSSPGVTSVHPLSLASLTAKIASEVT
ncbi:hypothetical protein C8K36_1011226 [Rhodococcus sp. OK519]|nr:hypothetical protein C8K36_1011226 [Rhodococcus sp. OK519]